jgi:ferredoxin, 2Fe-2S
MPAITYIQNDGTKVNLDVAVGKRVMQSALAAGIDGIVAECGGQAMCATCHVYVDSGFALPPMSEEEDEMLDDTVSERTDESRLSCQLSMTEELDGLIVRLPEAQI